MSWEALPSSPLNAAFNACLISKSSVDQYSSRFSLEMSYFYGGGGGQRQPKWNYQTNLDPNLLATVRDEMLRKEEEYRKEQLRIEAEQKKLTSYLTQLQAMVRDLPG